MGLIVNSNATPIWNCPDRRNLPTYEGFASPPQWVIGYSYFGGLTNWTAGSSAHSPVRLSNSRPYWVLAADALIKYEAKWAEQAVPKTDSRYYIYANCPPHKKGGNPAGGNEVFADGSAGWRNFDSWCRFTYWNGAYGKAYVYWSQDSADFEAILKLRLSALK